MEIVTWTFLVLTCLLYVGHVSCGVATDQRGSSQGKRCPQGMCTNARKKACVDSNRYANSKGSCQLYKMCCVPSGADILTKLAPDCGKPAVNQDGRIVGGSKTTVERFPWQVGIYIKGMFSCGGSLVSDRWVLTAAHCVDSLENLLPSDFTVLVGTTVRGQYPRSSMRTVSIIVAHKFHLKMPSTFDIALMKLSKPINPRSTKTRPICLPSTDTAQANYVKCVATGWGNTKQAIVTGRLSQQLLHVVDLPIYNRSTCVDMFRQVPLFTLCAGHPDGGKDTCTGDSGGPLACMAADGTWTQLGITSVGIGCGLKGTLGIYTDVKYFLNWVSRVLAKFHVK